MWEKIVCSWNDRKNVCSIDCYEEKLLQKFSAQLARILVYTQICLQYSFDRTLKIKNFSSLGNVTSSILHIPHNSFPYQKSWWKVQVNVLKPQELKIVYVESTEINGEKNCFVFDHRGKNCLLLKV